MTRPELPTIPDALVLGVDLSHHQDPARIDWDALARTHRFAIVRATYGTTRDRQVLEHARHTRDVGMTLGLYHFFRIAQNVCDQWCAFAEVADLVRLGPGDVVPSLDVEADTSPQLQPVQRSWSGPLRLMAEALAGRWQSCMPYGNASDFARLGNPEWLAQYPLWAAHWNATEPRCPPGLDWRVWQCRVGVLEGVYPGKLDQNVARLPLPVIEDRARERERVRGWIAETLDRSNRSRSRDR